MFLGMCCPDTRESKGTAIVKIFKVTKPEFDGVHAFVVDIILKFGTGGTAQNGFNVQCTSV